MADVKISALPAAGSSLGTDEIPVNQGGATKKVTSAQIEAYLAAFFANLSLSNLSSVNINTDLLFNTNDVYNIGANGTQVGRIYAHRLHGTNNNIIINLNTGQINDQASANLSFDMNSRTFYDSLGSTPMFSFLNPGILDAKTNKISNVVDPASAQDVATKNYVDIHRVNYNRQVPAAGFSITIANQDIFLILDPAGTLATGTITMPASPTDGKIVGISTTQTITSLTIQPNSGQTIADSVSTLPIGGCIQFLWANSVSTWYRVSN